MMQDLECYVDNSLLRNDTGAIVGRRGGVKAWLQENIPALYVRYTTVMRYKAMAKKLRQVAFDKISFIIENAFLGPC